MAYDIWSTMFNQSFKTIFSALTLKLTDGGARLKDGGVAWYYPLGKTLHYNNYICNTLHVHVYDQFHYNNFVYMYMYIVVITLCIF